MSNYSNRPEICRIDIFKESGKWYASGSIDMGPYYKSQIHEGVLAACNDALIHNTPSEEGWPMTATPAGVLQRDGWMIVCLEPYHQHSHPIMLKGR